MQLRPQLHHIDAYDEVSVKSKAMAKAKKDMDEDSTSRNAAMEARAIDMKVKSADTEGARAVGNNELLLKLFQDEKWEKYRWIDENVCILQDSVCPLTTANLYLNIGSRIMG